MMVHLIALGMMVRHWYKVIFGEMIILYLYKICQMVAKNVSLENKKKEAITSFRSFSMIKQRLMLYKNLWNRYSMQLMSMGI